MSEEEYAETCSCGLPPGECRVHSRAGSPNARSALNIDTLWADDVLRTNGRHPHVEMTRKRASRASQTQQEWRHGAIMTPRCDAITRIPERL